MRPGDPLEEGGPAAAWRTATKKLVAQAYGRWLGFLLDHDNLDPTLAPDDRVSDERFRGYIDRLQSQCLDSTVVMHVEGLVRTLELMVPDRNWSSLRRWARHLRQNVRRRKPKYHRMRSSRELSDLGHRLMGEADTSSSPAWKRAVRFRDGMLIALLAARPVRLKNLAALEINRHVVRTGDTFRLLLSPEETKTHVAVDLPIDGTLADRLDDYLAVHRPNLLGNAESAVLWITHDGRPMREGAVYKAITTRTGKAFGVAVNPHLFRDCAATTLAIEDPCHVWVAQTLLGHASLSSTTKYYNQANSLTASRRHVKTIMAIRRGPSTRRSTNWRPT